jgi:hypothetical protein
MPMSEMRPRPEIKLRTLPQAFAIAATGIREQLYHPLVQSVLHILRELVASGGVRLVGEAPDEERELFAQLIRTRDFDLAVRHLAVAHVAGVSAVEIYGVRITCPRATALCRPNAYSSAWTNTGRSPR